MPSAKWDHPGLPTTHQAWAVQQGLGPAQFHFWTRLRSLASQKHLKDDDRLKLIGQMASMVRFSQLTSNDAVALQPGHDPPTRFLKILPTDFRTRKLH